MGASDKGGTTQQYEHHPFQLSVEQLAAHFGGLNVEHGLLPAQVSDFRAKYGQNKLEGEGGVKWYSVLFKQISNAMILVREYPRQVNFVTNAPHRSSFSLLHSHLVSTTMSKAVS